MPALKLYFQILSDLIHGLHLSIYHGIVQKQNIAKLWVLTRRVIKLKQHHLAILIPSAERTGWNIERDLGSHDWPVSSKVESIDVCLALFKTDRKKAFSIEMINVVATQQYSR